MSGKAIVFLEDVADKLEETMDHWEQYLNTATGEFVDLSDGDYIEKDEELAEEIDSSCDYIRLPNQYDIHEYNIMKDFAEAAPDIQKREKLLRALAGRKPFRNFKDTLDYIGITDVYYAFRSLTFLKIAKEWCEDNDIPYKMREKQDEGTGARR